MKISHILEDFTLMSGGLRTVVKDLNFNLSAKGIFSEIISTKSEHNDSILLAKRDLYKEVWCYSKSLKNLLTNIQSDILHIHGVWMYPQYIASKIAYNSHKPYIITPHGMLEPWLWEKSKLKKQIYFNLLIEKYFSKANVLHAITLSEKDNLFKLFRHKSIEVIPNSISYNYIESMNIQKQETEKYILFVGRIDPKKGIDILINALSKIKNKNIKLKIAGPSNNYQMELIKIVKNLNIESNVEFLGMVSGREKYQLYKNAWIFVAPSYSEVVGMVNLEAGILGTPVITTFQTGLDNQWNNNGGILINPNVDELIYTLNEAIEWSESERNERGNKLREFIIQKYSWENNIHRWIELYNGLV